MEEDKSGAGYALGQIGLIHKVEAMANDQQMGFEERAALRKRLAYPVLTAFEKWIISYYPKPFKYFIALFLLGWSKSQT